MTVNQHGGVRPYAGWGDNGCLIDGKNLARITDITPAVFSTDSHTPLQFPDAKKVCFILIDGLGYRMLRERQGHAPTLRKLCLNRDEKPGQPAFIHTCIPSSTACNIPAFTTGAPPATTGMIGYEHYDHNAHTVINLLQFKDRRKRPHSSDSYYRCPTFFDRANDDGVCAYAYGPKKFEGSGMSNISLHGSTFFVTHNFAHSCQQAADDLSHDADIAYVYSDAIDHAGHKHGWQSYEWQRELEDVDATIGRLLSQLPPQTLVVMTADHGMVDISRAHQTDIAEYSVLSEGIYAIAGEPRALHLYANDPDSVRQRWQDFFGDRVVIVPRNEAPAYYGEPVNTTLPDLTVFSRDDYTIVDSRIHSPGARAMKGVHGSLTPGEMEIPLGIDLI